MDRAVKGLQFQGFGQRIAPSVSWHSTLDGNAIVGVGAPALSVASTNPNFAISEPTQTQPNMFGLTPSGVQPTSTTLTAKASFADPTTCKRPGASCVVRFSTSYNPYATDDWVTFAHDFARTGLETENTEITPSTVRSLKQRWKTPIGSTVYGTPVAYNGNVIVVTKVSPVVYDLSAVDGSTIWRHPLTGTFTKAEITIDTDDGLVLVGVSNTTGTSTVLPGTLYALRLSNGSIAWSMPVNGLVRAAPVYVDGVVYEGWAGGDPPGCTNGGVGALNAATGTQLWTWFTNPLTNPGGGGGIWGALAWDGTRVISEPETYAPIRPQWRRAPSHSIQTERRRGVSRPTSLSETTAIPAAAP